MSFTYRPGSTTPDYSGLFEIASKSLRICNVAASGFDPTFHPLVIPPISSTAPIRYNVKAIPRGGARVSTPLFDSWLFDVPGWFLLDDVADVQAATDYLTDRITVDAGLLGVSLNAPGWSAARTMVVKKGGPVVVTVPDKGDMASPYREFTLTFIAEDPLKYATAQTSTVIGTSATPVARVGSAAVPYTARFDGPNTGHVQVDASSGDASVVLDYALASGEFIEIFTKDGSYVTNTGVDMNPYIAIGTYARVIHPGGGSFTKSSGGGTPVATIKHYDGWE